ncbi:MAG: RsmD family RNA methyltransferase, partial [Amylibacter sp.]
MRIIGGRFKGTGLASVGKGDVSAHLRPTTDRVRESIFNLLVNGGYRTDVRKAYLFDPGTRTWSVAASTANLRFYPTTITLA